MAWGNTRFRGHRIGRPGDNDLHEMFDAEALIQFGGLVVVLLAIYAQTGLFFCFFIPSGAFIFMAGVLIADGLFAHNLLVVCSLGTTACLLGNMTSYGVGYKTGPLIYRRPDSRFFKKRHITAAENFFNRYLPELTG